MRVKPLAIALAAILGGQRRGFPEFRCLPMDLELAQVWREGIAPPLRRLSAPSIRKGIAVTNVSSNPNLGPQRRILYHVQNLTSYSHTDLQ